MNSIRHLTKLLWVILITMATMPVYGQYKTVFPITANRFEFQSLPYKNLVWSKMKKIDDRVYISWTVKNDTTEGYFAVYKASGMFGPFTPIEFIKVPKGLAKNVPIWFSSSDTTFDHESNFYFVVKFDDNTLITPLEEKILQSSVAMFVIDEPTNFRDPVLRKFASSELYTQEFDNYSK